MAPRHQRNLTRRKMLFALGGAAVAVPAIATIAPHALAARAEARLPRRAARSR